jgi:Ca2+-binding EF-hand superfamily protein
MLYRYALSEVQIKTTFCLVFQIFDDDGDGLLSYQEFVAMMKDRIHRGLKSYSRYQYLV